MCVLLAIGLLQCPLGLVFVVAMCAIALGCVSACFYCVVRCCFMLYMFLSVFGVSVLDGYMIFYTIFASIVF